VITSTDATGITPTSNLQSPIVYAGGTDLTVDWTSSPMAYQFVGLVTTNASPFPSQLPVTRCAGAGDMTSPVPASQIDPLIAFRDAQQQAGWASDLWFSLSLFQIQSNDVPQDGNFVTTMASVFQARPVVVN
jgi:hypothetical protein